MREVASIYPTLSCTFAGQQSWGNDTSIATVTDAVNYLQSTFGAASGKVLLVGQSMGHAVLANWARANRALVGGLVGIVPVSDLNDMVTNNRGGTAANINAAYGGTYSDTTHGPTHNPTKYAAADLASLPWLGFYASDDTTVVPSTVTGLRSLIGTSATAVNIGTGGHTDTVVANLNVSQLLAFLAANA
jgi:alpha-beta hydrolase superfamily lysophospholipase